MKFQFQYRMCKHGISPIHRHSNLTPKWCTVGRVVYIPPTYPRGAVCFQPIGAFVTTSDSSRLPASPVSLTFQHCHYFRCFLHYPGTCFMQRYSIKPLSKWPGRTNIYSPFGKFNTSTIPLLLWKVTSDNSRTKFMTHHCTLPFLKSMLNYTKLNPTRGTVPDVMPKF